MTQPERYFGKYRGTVVLNVDPLQRGRLQVQVPEVLPNATSSWAEACVPLSGATGVAMGVYVVPPIGAAVWVEFEHGDPDLPIWVGCRFPSSDDVPSAAQEGIPGDANIVIQSFAQHMIMISDLPPSPETGGVVLQSAGGASLIVNDSGIYLSTGPGGQTIYMTAAGIAFNTDAMTILP